MTNSAPDFTQAFEALFKNMPSLPKDLGAFTDSAKEMAEFNTKLNAIALEAAQKNVELSTKWTQDLLSEVSGLNKPVDKPEAFTDAATEVMSAQVKGTPERISQFAEVAKKAQVEAVELIMSATKDAQSKVAAATKA